MPRLEKWTTRQPNPFEPDFYLIGYVFDNPKFPDGALITSSRVMELKLDERYAITKSGTRYELGESLISDHYESEWYDGQPS